MFGKLFTTGDGKVPFVQIALGIVIGAIGVLIYARLYRPTFLFPENEITPSRRPQAITEPVSARKQKDAKELKGGSRKVTIDERPQHQGYEADDALVGAPVILDLGVLQTGGLRAPELPLPAAVYPPPEDVAEEDIDDDEDEIDEDEEELIRNSTRSGLTELAN